MLVPSRILTRNARSLILTILHLKPKVGNVLAKNWFINKNNLQKKILVQNYKQNLNEVLVSKFGNHYNFSFST